MRGEEEGAGGSLSRREKDLLLRDGALSCLSHAHYRENPRAGTTYTSIIYVVSQSTERKGRTRPHSKATDRQRIGERGCTSTLS